MESSSGAGNNERERPPVDEASSALEVIDRARRQAYAPKPFPVWYWVSTTIGLGVVVAAMGIENRAIGFAIALGYFILLGVATTRLRDHNGRTVQVRKMPRGLAVACIVPQIVAILLIIGIGCAVLLAGWPYPWLVLAAVLGAVIDGPVSDRNYRRAYRRWLAAHSS